MEVFFSIITSYPVAVYTFILLVVTIYWLIAILGMVDIDVLDLPDIDADFQVDSVGLEGLAGLFVKLGLHGIPITVLLSILTLFGWWIAYFLVWVLPFELTGFSSVVFGSVILFGSFVLAMPICRVVVKPLKPLFFKAMAKSTKSIIGQTAVLRTSRVDMKFGQAELNDAGAGLILNVRAEESDSLKINKGDRIVLLEYLENEHAYRVIPERDFY